MNSSKISLGADPANDGAEDPTRTIIAKQDLWVNRDDGRDACLIHIYPSGANMGHRYALSKTVLSIGRGEDSVIRIVDSSVSRKHATVSAIMPSDENEQSNPLGFLVTDCDSTNGTFVNDKQVNKQQKLNDGDYLRVGNNMFRYLTGGNVENNYHEEIYRLTIIDALTETYNARYFREFLEREVLRSQRHARPLSVLMMDVDKFKMFNDTHGHLCGDFVLREISRKIKDAVRKEDLFARYGGEEFVCVLVETQLENAKEVAERIRKIVAESIFVFENNSLNLTISIGIAFTTGQTNLTPKSILDLADQNLYRAKTEGRNKVVA